MDCNEDKLQNGDSESTQNEEEETSGDHTISDEQAGVGVDEHDTNSSTSRPTSSRRRVRRKNRRKKAAKDESQQFYNLRRDKAVVPVPAVRDTATVTLNDLAVDPDYHERLNGWKVILVAGQMDEISDLETSNLEMLSTTLCTAYNYKGEYVDYGQELGLCHRQRFYEMIEQTKRVRDKMQWSRLQMVRVFRHKSRVLEIVTRVARLMKRENGHFN